MSFVKIFLVAAVIAMLFLGIIIADTSVNQLNTTQKTKADSIVSNSIGTSTISLNKSTIDINSGKAGSISYTVKLASGTTWGTTISASEPSGFTTSFTTSSGDPTYSGTATISVASTVKNGTYTVSFTASGDDPTSSATSLTVKVSGYSSSPPTPMPHTYQAIPSISESLYLGVGTFLAFIILAFVPLSSRKLQSNGAGFVSYGISMASAIYLVVFDHTLYSSGYLHWIILVVFVILALATMIMAVSTRKEAPKTALAIGAFLMSIGMIADAALGLPLSSVQNIGSYSGFNYLFGFGTQSGSSLGVSLAFTLLLIFNGLVFSSFLRKKADTSVKKDKK